MATPSHESAVPLRLQLFLARSGVASRRGSENLMTAGRVRVNGCTVTELGTRIDPSVDIVEVDGRVVSPGSAKSTYLLLNKPTGYITSMGDPHGRPTVERFVRDLSVPGLFPVGRLDMDTSGLLIFTTDGELSHRLLHPRWKVPKTYVAQVDGAISESAIAKLRAGVELDDGLTAPAGAQIISSDARTSTIEIAIAEGRKRQVRRMCSSVGHPVLSLRRTNFGPVALGDLAEGTLRELSNTEVSALREAVGLGSEE